MAKKIKFTYGGKNYTLEFNRASVKQLEADGLHISDIEAKPLTTIQMLFSGAFLMHHRNVYANKALCDEIYDSMGDREKLLVALIEMYQEPVLTLMTEPDGAEESLGNTKWGAE